MSFTRRPAPALLILALSAALPGACSRQPEPAAAPAPVETPKPAPVVTLPPPALGRADLLRAASDAAAAYAAGVAAPDSVASLAGRRFRVSLAFGCRGPDEGAAFAYGYDPGRGVLKLSARPQAWTDTPLAALAGGGEGSEAVEGFWLRRPWMTVDGCPSGPPAAPGAQPSPETVGLAQVFEAGSSRLRRRAGQPFEVTRKAALDPAWMAGFRLVLEGRVAQADGRPIRCRSDHPDQRPVCVIRVELDRAAFQTAGGEELAEWSG